MATGYTYSDGKAVDVAAPKDVEKGDFVRAQGWNGVALETKNSGEYLALDVDPTRFHYVTLPSGITGQVAGTILYVDANGDLTATASGNKAALKLVTDEDANRVAGVRVLNIA